MFALYTFSRGKFKFYGLYDNRTDAKTEQVYLRVMLGTDSRLFAY